MHKVRRHMLTHCVCGIHWQTHTHAQAHINMFLHSYQCGFRREYKPRTLCYIHLLVHPSGYNLISAPHTQQEYQLTHPGNASSPTGGMWGLGSEITKRLKIDFGNREVALPNPLTSNPSHICRYCLVCFTTGASFGWLGRMRLP